MPDVARRMSRLGTENAFVVLGEVKKLQAQGIDIVSFGVGEPDFDTPENIKKAAIKGIEANHTHYPPSAGVTEFREVIAKYMTKTRGVPVHADNVVVMPGGKPIIFLTLLAVLDEGDEVIYPTPGYPIYESVTDFTGAKGVPYEIKEEKAFSFDIEEIKKLITSKTKLVVVNSPANPTGGVVPREDLEKLAELAKKHDFWVLSDEIYSRIVYEGEHESILQFPDMLERTIVLDGHSKTYAMTGWRLGYAIADKEFAERLTKLVINAFSGTAWFTQDAGIEAYTGSQAAVDKMVAEFKARRDLVVDGLNKIDDISCHRPKGAFYVFPNVTELCRRTGLEDAVMVQKYLLEVGHVAVLARTNFGRKLPSEDNEYIRLSYATSQENIKEGLKRIGKALSDQKAIEDWLANQ